MKNLPDNPDNQGILFLLLKNSIVQFIAGVLSILIVLKLANGIDYRFIQIVVKCLGYGFFCYLTTPFIIYWLAYVSQGAASLRKLSLTVAVMAIYSYIIWDAYFFFRGAISSYL